MDSKGASEDYFRNVSEGALFEETPPDGRVSIFRRDETDKTWVYHGILAPEEATCERVSALFGGGVYQAQLKGRNEQGRIVIRGNCRFRLAGPYRPPVGMLPGTETEVAKMAQVEQGKSPVVPAVTGPGTDARSVLEAATVSNLLDMMRAQKEMLSRPQMDWAAILTAVTPILVPLLSRREPVVNPAEIAEQITKAVQSAVTGMTAPQQPVNVIKQLAEAMDVLGTLRQDRDERDSDPMLGNLLRVAETLVQGAKGPAGTAVAPVPPGTSGHVPVPSGDVWRVVLERHGSRLVQFAAMRASPAWAAETALTLMPPDIREPMTDFLFREDVIQQIVAVVPRLASFPHWVQEFVQEARAQLTEDADAPETAVEGEEDHG